jgi:hypothetical protein
MEMFVEEIRVQVLPALRCAYSKLRDSDPAQPLSIDVSFDGTWMTRGHRSHVGAAFVIDCDTGFVVDYEVLCNCCEIYYKKLNSPLGSKLTRSVTRTLTASLVPWKQRQLGGCGGDPKTLDTATPPLSGMVTQPPSMPWRF